MNRGLVILGLLLLTACGSIKTKSTSEPESQDQLLLATLWFEKSAEMKALYYQCYNNAEAALTENLARGDRDKPAAVVLDIDETVLDNSPFQGWQILKGENFSQEDWGRWVDMAMAAPLPGAVEFTRFADSLGVEVFYISNRTTAQFASTIANMTALGFADADSTHLLLRGSSSSKVERRAEIEKGYEILLLIGDNLADLDSVFERRGDDLGFADVETRKGLFGRRYIILPNPMYGTWLSELLKKASGETTHDKLMNSTVGF